MTGVPEPAIRMQPGSGSRTTPAASAAATDSFPVIVLTYSGLGGERIEQVLETYPDLACTHGSGVLPLCEQAAATWQQTENGHGRALSPLAAASTRAMISSIITTLLARAGKRRWCEFSTAPPPVVQTFLNLYPRTRFVCVHSACPAFIRAVLDASPWGLDGPAFAPFIAAHSDSTVAALSAFWAVRTQLLIDFEDAHPGACLRVRYEDFTTGTSEVAKELGTFLGLAPLQAEPEPGQSRGAGPGWPRPERLDPAGPLPVGQIPGLLLDQVNHLLGKLSYQPMGELPGPSEMRSFNMPP
jgi:hypothetical protein